MLSVVCLKINRTGLTASLGVFFALASDLWDTRRVTTEKLSKASASTSLAREVGCTAEAWGSRWKWFGNALQFRPGYDLNPAKHSEPLSHRTSSSVHYFLWRVRKWEFNGSFPRICIITVIILNPGYNVGYLSLTTNNKVHRIKAGGKIIDWPSAGSGHGYQYRLHYLIWEK